jgi:hypothetical protein
VNNNTNECVKDVDGSDGDKEDEEVCGYLNFVADIMESGDVQDANGDFPAETSIHRSPKPTSIDLVLGDNFHEQIRSINRAIDSFNCEIKYKIIEYRHGIVINIR